MLYKIKLRIAGVIIRMESNFVLQQLTEEEKRWQATERFSNFFYSGRKKPHIRIKVKIVDKLPETHDTKRIFITHHFYDGNENWRLCKKKDTYIYKSPLKNKKQVMLINRTFEKVNAYLLPQNRKPEKVSREYKKMPPKGQKEKEFVWNVSDIIYDFLQVLLINYFALRNEGIFTHSVGIKD